MTAVIPSNVSNGRLIDGGGLAMADMPEALEKVVAELKQQRDELRVRAHLMAQEARDEWDELEKKWEHAQSRLERFGDEAEKASKEVASALKLVFGELKEGYARIKKAL
jgi:uncharacterized protein (DUF3084 family)